MTRARDYFQWVREQALDAERCQRQLKELEMRMKSLGGGGFEPRVRSTPAHDRLGQRVAAYMDREKALEDRMERDYYAIDRACVLLYGDATRFGLDRLTEPLWADVLWWRYLDGAEWAKVARAMGYSIRPCQTMHGKALRWIDENEFMPDIIESAYDVGE